MAMILLLVSMTLLLLRNNLISLHQSLNFVLSLLNYSGSGTMLLGTLACLLFSCIATGDIDISVSVHSFVLPEALFMIFNNPNLSDSAFILFSL